MSFDHNRLSFEYVRNFIDENGSGDKLISETYKRIDIDLEILCFRCKESYFMTFENFKRGHRCRSCSFKKIGKEKLLSLESIIEFVNIHGSGDKLISIEYTNRYKKLVFWCHGHNGYYTCSWSNFRKGARCKFCSDALAGKKKINAWLSEDYNLLVCFPEIAKDWDYAQNLEGPEKYLPNSNSKVFWLCPICNFHYYTRIIVKTRYQTGCPKCLSSKGEKKIEKYLFENKITYIKQYRFKDCRDKNPLPFDFYIFLNEFKLLIEFNGEQHYKTVTFGKINSGETLEENLKIYQKHDEIKRNYCLEKNINFIIIPYWDFDNIETILEKELSPFSEGGENIDK